MTIITSTIILSGALSYAPAEIFNQVAINRTNELTEHHLTHNYQDYDCLLGVPYGYAHLIDKEAYIIDEDNRFNGPFLIVDVEGRKDNIMKERELIADITCREWVHRKVELVVWD